MDERTTSQRWAEEMPRGEISRSVTWSGTSVLYLDAGGRMIQVVGRSHGNHGVDLSVTDVGPAREGKSGFVEALGEIEVPESVLSVEPWQHWKRQAMHMEADRDRLLEQEGVLLSENERMRQMLRTVAKRLRRVQRAVRDLISEED